MPLSKDPNIQVNEFQPRTLDGGGIQIRPFVPTSLKPGTVRDYTEVKKEFGNFASTDAKNEHHFHLHPASKLALGVDQEEKAQLEGAIQQEVEIRVQKFRDQGYIDGMKKGLEDGRREATEALDAEIRPKFQQFLSLMETFEGLKKSLFHSNEQVLVQLMFSIAKQVLLKELSTDQDYLKRLVSQVIERIGVKDHVRIKVNQTDQASIDAIREFLKQHYPDLRNIQIEASDDVIDGGCFVETDLIRVNASVQNQLLAIEESLKQGAAQ